MKKLLTVALVCCLSLCFGCDVDVKDKGELPRVDVKGGRMPDVDVRGPEVDVKLKKETVTVPDIDVKTKQTTVTVPEVDVKIPKENENK